MRRGGRLTGCPKAWVRADSNFLGAWVGIDEIDRAILDALQRNARIKVRDLAARVGLSASACFERTKRLERERVIIGYRAVIDTRVLGAHFEAWAEVALIERAIDRATAFQRHLHDDPLVMAAHQLAGPAEFLLHVAAPSINDWTAFLLNARERGFVMEVTRLAVAVDCIKRSAEVVHARGR